MMNQEQQQNTPIVEGQEPNEDLSHKWVNQNKDIAQIEQGIPLVLYNKLYEKRNLDMEYRLIRRITETQYHNDKLTEFKPSLSKMNRYNNIIPYKHTQVEVKVYEEEDAEFGQYINASWVNSCMGKDQALIATQGPKVETFNNFWKMIFHNNIENIIMLCRLKENDKSQCEQYWPNKNDAAKQYSQIKVECIDVEIIQEQIEKRTLLVYEQNNTENSKKVYQYQFYAWPDHQVPKEEDFHLVEYIVDLMVNSFNHNKQSVVHCSAGIGRTGTLISLVNIKLTINYYMEAYKQACRNPQNTSVEEIQLDDVYNQQSEELQQMGINFGKISVFGIVRRLREQRWGMVHTSEQYGYIYKYANLLLQKIQKEVEEERNQQQSEINEEN